MSNDLTVSPVTAAYAPRDTASQSRLSSEQAVMQPSQGTAVSPGPNPSLQLDAGLGLVVIEFRNDAGAVTTSIPSERQIQEYQRWQTTHFGPAPHGMHVTAPMSGAPKAKAA